MTEPAVIEFERTYAQSPATLWKALTDAALLARWWAPNDIKPVVGHLFEFDMGKWGKQRCEVLQVDPERLLQYRFATGVLDTVITWRLAREGSGTRLTLRHEGFDLDSPLGRQALEGMKSGWPGVLDRLGNVLAA